MGIDFHVLAFLNGIERKDFGDTLTIGRQNIHLQKSELAHLKRLGIVNDFSKLEDVLYVDPYLKDEFGASMVDSLDISNYEGASIEHDLNIKVRSSLLDRFDTIIDAGSLEHVFDIKQALENLVDMCRIGGRIIHVSPSDNFSGHGFWQISPELFFSLYCEENGFYLEEVIVASLCDRKKHYQVLKPSSGHRITLFSHSPFYVMAVARKIAKVEHLKVVQSDYKYVWSLQESNLFIKDVVKRSGVTSRSFMEFLRRFRILVSPSRSFELLNRGNEYILPFNIGDTRLRRT